MQNSQASLGNTMALLSRLKSELPQLMSEAQVVGKWVWLQFNIAPEQGVRAKLKELGFHWNSQRRCWQNPCGTPTGRSRSDPRDKYPVVEAEALALQEAIPSPRLFNAKEFKVVTLRECPLPEDLMMCDTPEKAAEYWRQNIESVPYYNRDCECFAVLMLNTRRRVKGHQLVTIGTLDAIHIHSREVFRAAIIAASSALISNAQPSLG